MSLEHHVRNEATFKNVLNLKIYVFQQEQETREEPLRNISGKPERLANGLEFTEGICSDSKGTIKTPEHPTSLCFGGIGRNTLFFTSRGSLFSVNIKNN